MALTDAAARTAKATGKDYKLGDAGGLYLFISKGGFKSWRMKYRFGKKEKLLTFGPYPDISLSAARGLRDDAKRLLREHRDPAIEKRKSKAVSAINAGTTFEKVARSWHESQLPRWSPDYGELVLRALDRDVFPTLGDMPLKEIDAPLVLSVLRKIEKRGSIETAKRIRQHVSAVFVFGISEGIASADPAALVGKALKPLVTKRKQPAFTDLKQARNVLIQSEADDAGPQTKLASRLLALTAVRPGIVRAAEWNEFEGIDWEDPTAPADKAQWRIPAARMKLELDRKSEEAFEHIVPLASQAVDVMRAVRRLTGRLKLVFHSTRSTHMPMSENTIGYMYNRIGFRGRHVPHGWRSTFSTIMNEWARGNEGDRAVIDLMLAHVPKGLSSSEAAYNRAAYMDRRRELAQIWADMLLEGMPPANDLLTPRR